MPNSGGKKAISLCILKILERESSFDNPLSYAKIARLLEQDYGIKAGRNAIGRNIALLNELGYCISTREQNRRGTYLCNRRFDDTELRVLIDSVLTSRFIPEADATRLIGKLASLSTRNFSDTLPHVQPLSEWNHQRNEQFFLNLDLLGEAIKNGTKAIFEYNRLGLDGSMCPIKDDKTLVNPYALVCANGQYYLIAGRDDIDELRHYRIDRMTEVEAMEQEARPITALTGYDEGLTLASYAREHGYMYGGKPEKIVLKVKRDAVNEVMDSFGAAAIIKPLDDEHLLVTVNSSPMGIRYWALQFGTIAEVLSPEHLREQLRADIAEMAKRYSD